MKVLAFCASVVLMLAAAVGAANAAIAKPVSPQEAQQWRQDLSVLASELPKKHKNAFARLSPQQFNAAVQRLDATIPTLSREEIIVELERIVAMVHDAHTGIQSLLYESPAHFRYIPAGLYLFKDGLYVYAADRRYVAAVGGKVVGIGSTSADEALARVAPLIPADNEMAVKERAPLYLETPEVLHALHITDSADRVPFTIEKGGKTFTVTVKALPPPKPTNDNWALGQRFSKMPSWVDARSTSRTPAPLWLRDPQAYFWHTYIPKSRTLYAAFNDVADKDNQSVKDWVQQLQAILDTNDVQRLVLDLRWNTGGNNYLNKPLLLALIKSQKVNRRGKLFVIIGRRNFSAAQNLINDIANYTDAIFVGEPTASTPNFYGDPAAIELPNSKLVVRASTLWWQDADPRDKRMWTAPDLAAELTSEDYKNNRDPAMDLIMRYTPETPIADVMHQAFAAGDNPAAIGAYRRFKADPVHAYTDIERAINSLGYKLLNEKRIADALTVFKLNAESYPGSPNVWDSLAEGYVAAGDKQQAILSYKKVLELDADNANAQNAIKRLEGGS